MGVPYAGECEGLCYLASAYTPGLTLGHWLAEQREGIEPDHAARIVMALAAAVQHVHEHGVLHRDIKPQNVLLDASVPLADLAFSPKLTDFGLAKLTDCDVGETATGFLLGTPRYMAPELAAGRREQLGPACDTYSLGVVLYELLTGRAPIEGNGHVDTLRRVVTDEPIRPRRLRRELSRDLEAICLTCLEKDPRRRYASARDLADDLRRYLERLPTRARPIRPYERLARWARRRPALAALGAVTIVATLLLLGGLIVHGRRLDAINGQLEEAVQEARTARSDAVASEGRTADLLYVSDMRLAGRAWKDGDMRSLADLLRRHVPADGQSDRRGFEWHFLHRLAEASPRVLMPSERPIHLLRLSASGWRPSARTASRACSIRRRARWSHRSTCMEAS